MPTFVALLRGINVGKARRVPMAELRALLGALGYRDATTLLNSGNAVFAAATGTPARLAADVAAAVASRFPFDVPVVVKSGDELAAIVAGNALAAKASDPAGCWWSSSRNGARWPRWARSGRWWLRRSDS